MTIIHNRFRRPSDAEGDVTSARLLLRDRVARALYEHDARAAKGLWRPWEYATQHQMLRYIHRANAALAAVSAPGADEPASDPPAARPHRGEVAVGH